MKSALLIIDVQSGLFFSEPRPYEADDVIQRINELSSLARANLMPVIHIQHEVESGNFMTYGSDSWQLPSALDVKSLDFKVRKTTPDSFLNTDLNEILTAHNITNVMICGYSTEFCVDTTTRRAAALGYSVQLISDAHTSRDKAHATADQIRKHHNAILPMIGSFKAKITAIRLSELSILG